MQLRESHSFRSVQEEEERRKARGEGGPLTAGEYESETEERPMSLKDHWLTLRQSVQEKITPIEQLVDDEKDDQETERIRALHELITPELIVQYQEIIKSFNGLARKSDNHPQREFIDVNDDKLSAEIEGWIEGLIREVGSKNESGLNEDDIGELRAQCWFLFDALGNVMNTKSLEKDITDFYRDQLEDELDNKEQTKQRAELVRELKERYPFDEAELGVLVDLVANISDKDKYSPTILVETIAKAWKEYGLSEKKGALAKISLGFLMARGAESFSPSLFQNIIEQDTFNVGVFLEYFGLNKISQVIDVKANIELTKLLGDVDRQINSRIVDSLFFQEFEFIHEKSLGEIYAALEAGKDATNSLLERTISQFVPTLTGIGLSLAFLAKVNPALGAIGICGLPVMYQIAKKQNKQIWPMYEKEKKEGEQIATELGSIKQGFEDVKTSSEVPRVAVRMKQQLDTKDFLSLQRTIEQFKMNLKQMIPFNVSTVVSAAVGGVMQEAGMISGGAVLSNIIYSERMNHPVQELVELYFNRFSRYVQDIQRMDEILGKYDQLDLPEGEMESERKSVLDLENFDISIRGLYYKNILKGVNLDIGQGEFVSIAGASGAGKSTLLRNLVGLYRPEGGEITIGGVRNRDIKKYGPESIYSVMSYSNQSPQIFEGMTLRENLLLFSRDEVSDQKIMEVLSELHLSKLTERLDQDARNLSGGERVRIGLARTLLKGAKILLLDEPTASLDSQAATEVRKVISEIRSNHPEVTIVCVSHDEEMLKTGDRIVQMSEL